MLMLTPNLSSVIDQDGAVILDVSHNSISTLDELGAYVWERLERGVSIGAIASEVASETGENPSTIAIDLADFIGQLKTSRLVVDSNDRVSVSELQNG